MGPRTIVRGNFNPASDISRQYKASMGPRTIVRGNARLRPRPAAPSRCFNGAADDRPRKFLDNGAVYTYKTTLQWGRGRSSAEIVAVEFGAFMSDEASMGPRTIVRGNIPFDPEQFRELVRLQWGRGRSSAEMSAADTWARQVMRLQWGRGRSSAEICPGADPADVDHRASMGPRTIVRGNSSHGMYPVVKELHHPSRAVPAIPTAWKRLLTVSRANLLPLRTFAPASAPRISPFTSALAAVSESRIPGSSTAPPPRPAPTAASALPARGDSSHDTRRPGA